eukprot:gene7741-5430_t
MGSTATEERHTAPPLRFCFHGLRPLPLFPLLAETLSGRRGRDVQGDPAGRGSERLHIAAAACSANGVPSSLVVVIPYDSAPLSPPFPSLSLTVSFSSLFVFSCASRGGSFCYSLALMEGGGGGKGTASQRHAMDRVPPLLFPHDRKKRWIGYAWIRRPSIKRIIAKLYVFIKKQLAFLKEKYAKEQQ